MLHNPLISIVVPIYMVEQYLNQCVESIVRQTYQNLEIILVDDGSTDNSGIICDEWSKRDSRILVIHKENGGLSDARNAGMQIATGELIGFVDSDDYISENMYELLYNNMVENGSDISACGIDLFWDDETPSRMLTPPGNYLLTTNDALKATIQESLIVQPVVYKLYKRKLITDILFPVGKYHEDVFWTYQAVSRAEKVSIFDTPCYFYRQRSGSIMGTDFSLKRLDALEAKVQRAEFIRVKYPTIAEIANCDVWFSCMYMMQQAILHLSREDYRIAKTIILQYKASCTKINHQAVVGIKQKTWLFLSKINFILTCKIRNFLKIGL